MGLEAAGKTLGKNGENGCNICKYYLHPSYVYLGVVKSFCSALQIIQSAVKWEQMNTRSNHAKH